MITINESSMSIAELHRVNRNYSVSVLGDEAKIIKLPEAFCLNLSIVENYFYDKRFDGLELEDNEFDFVRRWVAKHQKVYSISEEKGLMDVSVITCPLEAFRGNSIFYAKREDAIYHCAVHFSFVLDYKTNIDEALGNR